MIMPLLVRINFIKTKAIFRCLAKGVSNQVSQIRIMKLRVIHVQVPVSKWEITIKWKTIFRVTKRGNKGISNWRRFQGLQIGAREITNRGSLNHFKSGQEFQIGEKRLKIRSEITNRSKRDFKSWQGLQIGAEHHIQ